MIERVRYKFSMNSKNDLEGRREKKKKKLLLGQGQDDILSLEISPVLCMSTGRNKHCIFLLLLLFSHFFPWTVLQAFLCEALG